MNNKLLYKNKEVFYLKKYLRYNKKGLIQKKNSINVILYLSYTHLN